VDSSPIATIDEDHFDRIENALNQLISQGYISEFTVSRHINTHLPVERQSRTLSTRWISHARFRSSSSRLSMNIVFYHSEERAISWLQSTGRLNPHHVYIQNDNNTDAIMLYPWMPVSASGWFVPSDLRRTRTEIRIGSVIIQLSEVRAWSDFRNDYSSQFIAALVAALQEE